MDWDESLYFLVAAQWRAGQLPYTTIWDNKPVGIYAILAVFQALFGERVFAMRIASAVVGGLTAYVVYRIGRQLNGAGRRGPALLAGGAYLVCSLSNDGMAANTEPFMAGFTALAVLTAAGPGWPWRRGVLAGVLVGAAFMVKYVAVFEAPAVLLLLLLRHPTPGWRGRIGLALAFGAGAAAPLAATILLYWHAGALGLWWSASVASNFRRVGGAVPPGALAYAARLELLRLGPLLGLGLLVLAAAARLAWRRPWRAADGVTLFLALWLLGGCVGVAAAKSFYDHYFLQLLPVLCVTLGWWASCLPGWRRPMLGLAAALVLALPAWAAVVALRQAAAPVLAWQGTHFVIRPDTPRLIARDLAPALGDGGLYVFDGQPILYALLRRQPPTRYVFPSILTTGFLAHVAEVDAPAEVTRILAGRPRFIVRSLMPRTDPKVIDPLVYALLDTALAKDYRLWRRYPGSVVYRLR